MSPDFVKRSVNRRPFRPFIIHLADGRSLPVRSPEFVLLPEEGRLVLIQGVNGSTHVVDLLLATDLEFPNASILE
jgi:hypothetical protein